MSEIKKKIIINHEHLNPNSQKRNNGSGSRGRPGRTLKKMPGFVRPSELKNNLIKLLKQKREEKQQEKREEKQQEKQQTSVMTPNIVTNDKPLFDKKNMKIYFQRILKNL